MDVIKIVQDRGGPRRALEPIPVNLLCAIIDEAHHQGLPVTAHWGTIKDLEELIAAGVDGLQHLEPRGVLEGWPDEVLDLLVLNKVSLTPTLTVTDLSLPRDITDELRRRVREFHGAGGKVTVGSDVGMPGVLFGPGVHREIELLLEWW